MMTSLSYSHSFYYHTFGNYSFFLGSCEFFPCPFKLLLGLGAFNNLCWLSLTLTPPLKKWLWSTFCPLWLYHLFPARPWLIHLPLLHTNYICLSQDSVKNLNSVLYLSSLNIVYRVLSHWTFLSHHAVYHVFQIFTSLNVCFWVCADTLPSARNMCLYNSH